MKDKTECFPNTKIFTFFKVGTIYAYVIKILEIICYSQKRFVFLHRNQNLILFINEVNYFLREFGKRFHEDI